MTLIHHPPFQQSQSARLNFKQVIARAMTISTIGLVAGLSFSCQKIATVPAPAPQTVTTVAVTSPVLRNVIAGAIGQQGVTVSYDPAYVALPYPNGDLPLETGVCTDVVIRAFRHANVDLQQLVHEDMQANFAVYPKNWGLSRPDTNIDHRRVPNLMTFFERQGKSVAVSQEAQEYQPGDVVSWQLNDGQQHIGLVSDRKSPNGNLMIVHNIGSGVRIEDVLFRWKILGHYRYF